MPYFRPKTAENTANGKAIAVSDAVLGARKIPAKFSTRSDFVEKNGPNKAKIPPKFSTCSDFASMNAKGVVSVYFSRTCRAFLPANDSNSDSKSKSSHHFSHSIKKVARHRTTFF